MIPLRVKVQGFLSYRDVAILEFDGASLWTLTGDNGTGKSAIFDAVTFALYGVHRGGKQRADKLINHQCDKLLVEFDFQLNEDVYRAKRTEGRRGQPTRQIIHLSGPNAPVRKRSGEAIVPGTDSKDGFDNWVRQYIGLSDKTFMASVMLRQGENDALLKMDGSDRHTLLTQLVDLSRYTRLADRAKDKQDENTATEKSLAGRLERLPEVLPETIDNLIQQIEAKQRDLDQAQTELQQIAVLKTHAEHWQKRVSELRHAEDQLTQIQGLLNNAQEIEPAAQRLGELDVVLPIMKRLVDAHTRATQAGSMIAERQQCLTALRNDKDIAAQKGVLHQGDLDTYYKEQEAANLALQQAQDQLLQLKPAQHDLERRDSLQHTIEEIDRKLAGFPKDLDAQASQVEQTLEHLTEVKSTLPDLRQIHESRQARQVALDEAREWDARKATFDNQAKELTAQQEADQAAEEKTNRILSEADQQLALTKASVNNLEERLGNLESLKGQPSCMYCGQALTPKHLKDEQARLKQELSHARTALQNAQEARDTAKKQLAQIVQSLTRLERKRQTINDGVVEARQAAKERRRSAQEAQQRAQDALSRLPEDIQARINDNYPSKSDLDALENEISSIKSTRDHLTRLKQKVQEHTGLRSERKPLIAEQTELASKYSDDRSQAIRTQIHDAQVETNRLQKRLASLGVQIKQKRSEVDVAAQRLSTSTTQIAAVERDLAVVEQQLAHANVEVAQAQAQMPEEWHATIIDLTAEQLQAFEAERHELDGSDKQLTRLQQAQQIESQTKRDIERLQTEIASIPPEAHFELTHFTILEQQIQTRQNDATTAMRRAEVERARLEERAVERLQVEQQRLEAARLTQRYKTLAELLGREGLQRHLLEQVERAIVNNANEVLDKISGGDLRLELQGDSGASKTKALELVAYNRANNTNGIAVDFLSGSQRFRTAVSLALGIGQYASQDSHRVEAVVIDEGFGSLDKTGRQEMIDELHNLKSTLSRIILVSHQEEFAQAFPHRYAIRIQDGSSTATLEIGSE